MRNRQHVNVNALAFETFSESLPVLEKGKIVELEIGCADAQFLFERAKLDPQRTYIGLEIRKPLVDAVNRNAKQRALPVQAIFVHATHHLEKLLPKNSVRHCFLNFPDPWFKRKHHDRRMINEILVRKLAPLLEPGGDVLIQSDVFDVALDAMAVFESCDDLYENLRGPWTFWKEPHPFQARSWREQNCEETSLPIWRIRYRPLDATPAAPAHRETPAPR